MATSRLRKAAYSTAVLGAGALAASWLTNELVSIALSNKLVLPIKPCPAIFL